jgi:mono/diheme cytochrome c family protein
MPPIAEEQSRNLRILGALIAAFILLVIVAGYALYSGAELPPAEMQTGHSSSDGYAPPAHPEIVPGGSVPRGVPVPAAPGRPEREAVTPDAATLSLGKRAYDVNCAMCHGAPGGETGPVGKTYVPRPPDLAGHAAAYPPERLYAMITDGIRSTPTPEAARYLPREWHAYRAITTSRERWAMVRYIRSSVVPTRVARGHGTAEGFRSVSMLH